MAGALPNTVAVSSRMLSLQRMLRQPARRRPNAHLVVEDMLTITIAVVSRLYSQAAVPTKQALSLVPEEGVLINVMRGDAPPPVPPSSIPRAASLLGGQTFQEALTGFVHHLADADEELIGEIVAFPPIVTVTFEPEVNAEIAVPAGAGAEWRRRFVSPRRARRKNSAIGVRHQAVLTIKLFQFLAKCWRDSRAAMPALVTSSSGGNSDPETKTPPGLCKGGRRIRVVQNPVVVVSRKPIKQTLIPTQG